MIFIAVPLIFFFVSMHATMLLLGAPQSFPYTELWRWIMRRGEE